MTLPVNSTPKERELLVTAENESHGVNWGRVFRASGIASATGAGLGLVISGMFHAPNAIGQSIGAGVAIGGISSAAGGFIGSLLHEGLKPNCLSRVIRGLSAGAGGAATVFVICQVAASKYPDDPTFPLWLQATVSASMGVLPALISGAVKHDLGKGFATVWATIGAGSLSSLGLAIATKEWVMPSLGNFPLVYGFLGWCSSLALPFNGACIDKKQR